MSKLKIYDKSNSQFSTGKTLVVELDGKVVPYCTGFKLECQATGIAKLTLEMVVHIDDVDISGVDVEEI